MFRFNVRVLIVIQPRSFCLIDIMTTDGFDLS